MGELFYDARGGSWEEMGSGQKRKIIHMDNLTVMMVSLPKGTVTDPGHKHPNEQAAVVVSGRVKMFIGDEVRELGPGGGYLVPPEVLHHVETLEDTVLIDYFTPRRRDLTAT
jgi:quercetin dioxygenase-like cupin family protein